MKMPKDISYTSPADDVRKLDVYLPEKGNGLLFFYMHGGHCAYIAAKDEKGESVFGRMIWDYLQKAEGME